MKGKEPKVLLVPRSLVLELFFVGTLAGVRGEIDQGVVLFRALRELRPEAEIIATYLAYFLYLKGSLDEALDVVETVVSDGIAPSSCMRAVRAKVWFMANDPRWEAEVRAALELEAAEGGVDEKTRNVLDGLPSLSHEVGWVSGSLAGASGMLFLP